MKLEIEIDKDYYSKKDAVIFKCPACGGEQYAAADTTEECIYCGHQGELEKMPEMEPEKVRDRDGKSNT